eukprot:GHVS01021542.1.p1 GENE.GHVS01021542.1~~GHVS01021542.1.p1  ORF type:complete len:345 (+),score=30.92 GHVS01021542.1:66-1037(+)
MPPYLKRSGKSSFQRTPLQTNTLPTSSFPPPPPASGQRFGQLHPAHGADGGGRGDQGSRGPRVDLVGRVVAQTVGLFESFFCLECHLPMATRMRTLPCFHAFCEECGSNIIEKCPTCGCKVSRVESLHPDDVLRQCAVAPSCLKCFLNEPSLHYHYKHDHGVAMPISSQTPQPSEPVPSPVDEPQPPTPSALYPPAQPIPCQDTVQYSDNMPNLSPVVPTTFHASLPPPNPQSHQPPPSLNPEPLLESIGRDPGRTGHGAISAGGRTEHMRKGGGQTGKQGRAIEGSIGESVGVPVGVKPIENSQRSCLTGEEDDDDDLEDLI